MAKTLIRKDQIRIDEFIQALSAVDWSSDTLTASAAAIAEKIRSEVVGVTGAMLYRGAWTEAATDAIKKGYVYVYNGDGTAPTGVTLEEGDTLIANTDAASITNANNWTIVQVNITGAVTQANLVDQLLAVVTSGNGDALTIDRVAATNDTPAKLKLTVKFPIVQDGTAVSGQYVSGMSINPDTGVITLTRAALPAQTNWAALTHLEAACTGNADGSNKVFKTPSLAHPDCTPALYVNGVKQAEGAANDYTYAIDASGYGVFTLTSSAYVPKSGDTVTCSFIKKNQ